MHYAVPAKSDGVLLLAPLCIVVNGPSGETRMLHSTEVKADVTCRECIELMHA